MRYGTFLLHLDDQPLLEQRIEAALHLAGRFEAHLLGVAATGNISFGEFAAAGALSHDALEEALRESHLLAQARAQHFVVRATGSRAPSFDTRVEDDDDAAAVARAALCSDLVIVGQPDPTLEGHVRRRHRFEQIVLNAAPPVLILPRGRVPLNIGSRIVVGWNASRECSRAVVGALPFLQRAASVQVIHCDGARENAEARGAPGIDAARDWLARHGVTCDASVHRIDADVGEHLMAHAAHVGADLLVIGAWSRPRWSERFFGGTTQTILESLSLPVLTAH